MNEHEQAWRYSFLGLMAAILPIMIVFQVVRIRVSPEQAAKILEQGEKRIVEVRTIVPPRGQIFDRRGNLLAGNKTVYEVGIELREVKNPQTVALTLSTMLGLDYEEVLKSASMPYSDKAVNIVVADNVSQEEVDKLRIVMGQITDAYSGSPDDNAPSVQGVVFQPHLARSYPEKSLGSNILGFVNRQGIGYYGVEEKFNDILSGKPETVLVPLDPNRVQEMPVIPGGASLVLTIEREIQRSMEQIIDAAVEETGADSGTLVVMDPRTGEIMALATTPRMDLNLYWHYTDIFPRDTPFNRGVMQAYEPGSVFKVLTMAAALDAGAVTPDTPFTDTGAIDVGGILIYNWNMGAWGPQDMVGCLQHSLNVCLAWVATQLGTDSFYRYLQAFGIGHLSGVDMAGEEAGRLKIPGDSDWYQADLGTNAFGQGVAATPLQMAAAVSALANQGKLMAPHIVRSVVNEGYQYDIQQQLIGMPIKPETASTITEMLAQSLEIESSDALVTGYRVAGKTGTAEIPTPLGYTTNATNASFVGWGPVDDPRFLVYVWLERPKISAWGSVVASPVFRQVVEKLVVLINLPPDEIRLQLAAH